MSTPGAPLGCNQYGHAPGCMHVTGEDTGVLLVVERPAPPSVGACPDCTAPMPGHAGDGKFVPGSQCRICHHLVADMLFETEATYDAAGRTYLYTLEEDATIRITDDDGDTVSLYQPGDGDWESHIDDVFEMDPDAARRAFADRDDPNSAMERVCRDAGLYDALGAYEVILDRDRVPLGHLLTQTPDDIESHYETYLGPAVDDLSFAYAGNVDSNDPDTWVTDDDMMLVRKACDDAGLPSMKHFYDLAHDRGCLSSADANALSADDVTTDYEQHVAPAIDRLEDRLLADYRYERAEAEVENFDEIVEDLTSDGLDWDTTPVETALENAWDTFDQADGTHEAMLAYADAIEAVGDESLRAAAEGGDYNRDEGPGDSYGHGDQRDRRYDAERVKVAERFKAIADRLRRAAEATR